MWQQVNEAIRGGRYTAPKTILGFLGAIYVAALSFSFAVILAIVRTDEVRWLVGPVLGFVAVSTVALVAAVLWLAKKDPTPLVLGQITGGEYNEHRRLTQGDSLTGERILTPGVGIVPADEDIVPADAEELPGSRENTLGEPGPGEGSR